MLIRLEVSSAFFHNDERGLHQDYECWLEKLIPQAPVRG